MTQGRSDEEPWNADDEDDLLLMADRERIARALNDLVIQRLFRVSMNLHGCAAMIDPAEPARRLAAMVDELDATINEIRCAIFGLQPTGEQTRQP
jgi:signal transduction histidine kinase